MYVTDKFGVWTIYIIYSCGEVQYDNIVLFVFI